MSVKLSKLVSGEEVISDLHYNDDGTVTLNNPVLVQVMPTANGQVGVNFMPLSLFAKEPEQKKITLNKNHIMFSVDPETELASGYCSKFGGVIVAGSGLVL